MFQIYVNTEGQYGRLRYPAGSTAGKPGTFMRGAANYSELTALNERAAIAVQAEVVENVQQGILRRAASSGRLVSTTADKRNRYADRFGWGVGVESFLDRSNAKYWRQIEEGTNIHVGREIKGVWGDTVSGFYNNAWGRVPSASGRFTASGQGYGGKFAPRRTGRYFDPGSGHTSNFMSPGWQSFRKTTIQNPIEAMGAYADARDSSFRRYTDKTVDEAREVLFDAVRSLLPGF